MKRYITTVLAALLTMTVMLAGCSGKAEHWAYNHEPDKDALVLYDNGKAVYKDVEYTYTRDDTFINLTDQAGETVPHRYIKDDAHEQICYKEQLIVIVRVRLEQYELRYEPYDDCREYERQVLLAGHYKRRDNKHSHDSEVLEIEYDIRSRDITVIRPVEMSSEHLYSGVADLPECPSEQLRQCQYENYSEEYHIKLEYLCFFFIKIPDEYIYSENSDQKHSAYCNVKAKLVIDLACYLYIGKDRHNSHCRSDSEGDKYLRDRFCLVIFELVVK